MPSGTRISEPVSTGVAVSRPNCVAFRSSVFLIGMPMTANIIQTAKHTVKATVLMITTDHCLVRRLVPLRADLPATAAIAVSSESARWGQASRRKGLFHDPHQAAPDAWTSEESSATQRGVVARIRWGGTMAPEGYP